MRARCLFVFNFHPAQPFDSLLPYPLHARATAATAPYPYTDATAPYPYPDATAPLPDATASYPNATAPYPALRLCLSTDAEAFGGQGRRALTLALTLTLVLTFTLTLSFTLTLTLILTLTLTHP